MSEYVSLESRPEENSDKSVGDDRKPNGIENEENASLRARETAGDGEFNTNKIVSGCTAAEATFDYSFSVNQNELDDANFQLRTQSISLNSDSTDGGFVTNEEEHENSTDIGLKGNSEVARNSEEDQTREMDDGTEDPFLQSVKYLEKHQILRLFQVRLLRLIKIINLFFIISHAFT